MIIHTKSLFLLKYPRLPWKIILTEGKPCVLCSTFFVLFVHGVRQVRRAVGVPRIVHFCGSLLLGDCSEASQSL